MGPLWGKNNVDRMRDRIVLVPGNHDVNLRFSACDNRIFNPKTKAFEDETIPISASSGPYLRHHDFALEPFRRFARQLTSDRNWENSLTLSWVDRRFCHCGIRFFVLNSVVDLSAAMPDKASFSEPALREIARSLGNENPDLLFSIAVSHHGLRPEGAPTEQEVGDWRSVGRDVFAIHKIRLWLYGHYHSYDARSLNGKPFEATPLWLVQAPTTRIGHATRGFCVIELCRREGKVTDAYIQHYMLQSGTTVKGERRRIFDKG
jgi:hypothetical protein